MSPLKRFATVFALTAGTYLGAAAAAQADCYVTNADRRGFFGEQRHSRQFSGDSARTIWERYCKPFIQNEVANNGIRNGRFGMQCTGRLSCTIEGRIENGRVVTTRLDFGAEGQGRVESRTAPVAQPETRRVTPEAPVETRVITTPPARTRTHGIYSDPGWATFDRLVADCEARRQERTVIARRPTCN